MKKIIIAGVSAALLFSPVQGISGMTQEVSAAAVNSAYQDAVTQGNLLLSKVNSYKQAISSGDMSVINSLYDGLTKQKKITETKIGAVSGASNRAALLKKYVTPAKVEIERTIYEVSQYRLLDKMEWSLDGEDYTIDSDMAKLQRMKRRAAEIKESGGYEPLPAGINADLREYEAYVQGVYLYILNDMMQYTIEEEQDIYSIEYFYDDLTYHLRQTELKIGQVAGKTNREHMLKDFVNQPKVTVERIKYEVSQLRLIYSVLDLIEQEKIAEAKTQLEKLAPLKARGEAIKKAGGYEPLPQTIHDDLASDEDYVRSLLAE